MLSLIEFFFYFVGRKFVQAIKYFSFQKCYDDKGLEAKNFRLCTKKWEEFPRIYLQKKKQKTKKRNYRV